MTYPGLNPGLQDPSLQAGSAAQAAEKANFPAARVQEGWRMEGSPLQGRFFTHSGIINDPALRFFPLALIVVAHCIKYIKSFFFKTSTHVHLTEFPAWSQIWC